MSIQGLSESNAGEQIIRLAARRLSEPDAARISALIDQVLELGSDAYRKLRILGITKPGVHTSEFNSLALLINRQARRLSHDVSAGERALSVRMLIHLRERIALQMLVGARAEAASPKPEVETAGGKNEPPLAVGDAIAYVYTVTVGRSPADEEIAIWKRNLDNGLPFHEFLLLMKRSQEAGNQADRRAVLATLGNGECVQATYEIVLGRGAAAWEISYWLPRLESGSITRAQMLATLLEAAFNFRQQQAEAPAHDGLSCLIMGTGKHLTAAQWQQQAEVLQDQPPPDNQRYRHRFHIKGEPRVLVSALCSLYRGGDFIEQFMDNITSQDCFDDFSELVIVDADSPEDEFETIKRYLASHKNIQYHRMKYRIGIYDAWNFAARAARGEYLTNTNLDDLRRSDSFAIQAGVLDNLPFVDVTYQDLYYTFDPRLKVDQIAAFGHKTLLPVITPHNMIRFNSPHNAPMWRKQLHEELGWFDTRYKSAGDYEFWMRCINAGKVFYKTNDPHVVYYQNPQGLSTRPDTRGVAEAMDITRRYCSRLVPRQSVMASDDFARELGLKPAAVAGRDRYAISQLALRNLARTFKDSRRSGVSR